MRASTSVRLMPLLRDEVQHSGRRIPIDGQIRKGPLRACCEGLVPTQDKDTFQDLCVLRLASACRRDHL
jgi:hypothetical protein